MADKQPTYIPIDSNTRIQLGSLLIEASAALSSLAMAIEVLANANQLPKRLNEIAEHTASALTDLDDRVQAFLDSAEQG